MPLDELLPIGGDVFTVSEGHVYLKRAGTIENFVYGGECMRTEESDADDGTPVITTKLDTQGGVRRDQVHDGAPGQTSFSLAMKRARGSRIKSELRSCWWMVDQRMSCGGINRDAWNNWEEITRYCMSKTTNRTMSGVNWESPSDEQMVGFPMVALDSFDLYRVNGAGTMISGIACFLNDVNVCQGARCPDKCSDQEECVIVSVSSLIAAGSPVLATNLEGGNIDAWTTISLTEWTTAGADRVLCLGEFLIIVSTGETAILRSDDRGVSRFEIDETVITDWAANPPTCIDGINQNLLVMGGENGYIYRSTDAGRNWVTVSPGSVLTDDVENIRICRDDPQVIYACGASNAVWKSTNGGRNWFMLTGPSVGDGLLDIYPLDVAHVLVANDDGEIWESSDGGATWTQQLSVSDKLPATASSARFDSCGCEEVWLVITDGTNNLVLRNVENGSDGRWYEKIDTEWDGDGSGFLDSDGVAVACCGPNNAVVVGGSGTDAFVYQLS